MAIVNNLNSSKNSKDSDMFLILEAIQDPGNMGTIIRAADAFLVEKVFVSEGSVDIFSPKVLRATMGSVFRTTIEYYNDIHKIINKLKESGAKIFVTDLKSRKFCFDVNMKEKCLLLWEMNQRV